MQNMILQIEIMSYIAYLDPKTNKEAEEVNASGLIYVNTTSHVLIQMLQNVRADYLWESTINNSLTHSGPLS